MEAVLDLSASVETLVIGTSSGQSRAKGNFGCFGRRDALLLSGSLTSPGGTGMWG